MVIYLNFAQIEKKNGKLTYVVFASSCSWGLNFEALQKQQRGLFAFRFGFSDQRHGQFLSWRYGSTPHVASFGIDDSLLRIHVGEVATRPTDYNYISPMVAIWKFCNELCAEVWCDTFHFCIFTQS